MENEPEAISALREDRLLIGTTDSFLMWTLTGGREGGVHITDVTNASLTGNVQSIFQSNRLINTGAELPLHDSNSMMRPYVL